MPVVSISLTSKILKDLEKITNERGYFSRSEAIRDAIRNIVLEYDLSLMDKDVVFATIIVAHEFARGDIDNKLSKLRHEYEEIVIENIHRHVKDQYCIELFVVEGKNSQVLELIGRVRGIKGINQVKYIVLPLV
ncbi:MAG: CopG family ribbon-helix-helix protein [Candidatus Helarchaeota archaeon]|nr:CopG family ribbon-helix-helix protein [Candidatus Helarchaeota archaeon]